MSRRCVWVGALGATSLVALACGSSPSSGGGADAGADVTAPPAIVDSGGVPGPPDAADAALPATLSLTTNDVVAYVGEPAVVGARVETTSTASVTFTWTIEAVAPGSALATGAIGGIATAPLTFTADAPGEYRLQVTAVVAGLSRSRTLFVRAFEAPVFFAKVVLDASAVEIRHAGASTGENRVLTCPLRPSYKASASAERLAKEGADWWEAPAGEGSRLVFVFDTLGDGGRLESLAIATSKDACDASAPPFRAIDSQLSTLGLRQPRLSPDGKRALYLRNDVVATIDVDDGERRDIGVWSLGGNPPRAQWVDGTHVAWADRDPDDDSGAGWRIVVAPDVADGGSPSVYLRCKGLPPKQIEILKDGRVLVVQPVLVAPDGGAATIVDRLYRYRPNLQTQVCDEPEDLLASSPDLGFPADFSISPDRERAALVVRVADDAGTSRSELVTISLADTTVSRLGPSTYGATYGPRWVAAGTSLAFGNGTYIDAGGKDGSPPSSNIAVLRLEGDAGGKILASSTPEEPTYAFGNGNPFILILTECSMPVAVRGAPAGAVFFGIVAAVGIARRRRRR